MGMSTPGMAPPVGSGLMSQMQSSGQLSGAWPNLGVAAPNVASVQAPAPVLPNMCGGMGMSTPGADSQHRGLDWQSQGDAPGRWGEEGARASDGTDAPAD